MRSLSRLQKTFLLVGAALIATALLIPNSKTSIPIIVPDILWDRFSFSPRPEIEVIENNPSSIVFASSIHPQARLTVAKNGNFRNAPKDIVTALCRNEMCTYKAYENRKMVNAFYDKVYALQQKMRGATNAFDAANGLLDQYERAIDLDLARR